MLLLLGVDEKRNLIGHHEVARLVGPGGYRSASEAVDGHVSGFSVLHSHHHLVGLHRLQDRGVPRLHLGLVVGSAGLVGQGNQVVA